MCCNNNNGIRYSPLFSFDFHLTSFRRPPEAENCLSRYKNYNEIDNVPDRLRRCRQQMKLTQKEVSELTGISRHKYADYESGVTEYIPKDTADKLAEFYNIPVSDLLDDFNRFRYIGQSKLIKSHRESLGYTLSDFAQLLGVHPKLLKAWESETKQLSRKSWEKYFKNIIPFDVYER